MTSLKGSTLLSYSVRCVGSLLAGSFHEST